MCMCVCSGVCIQVYVCVCTCCFHWCCIVNRLVKSNRKPSLVAVVAVTGRIDGGGEGGAVFRSL